MNSIPDWLIGYFRVALIGEVYPQIRAISVRYNKDKELLLRYYLDREPTEFDNESIEVVATNLEATMPPDLLTRFDVECHFSKELAKDLDPLDGFIYSRREYEIQENPSQKATYFISSMKN